MAVKIQLRRGTAAQWTAANPILYEGEFGFETDTRRYKIGNGVHAWNDSTNLPYYATGTLTGVTTASGSGLTGGALSGTLTLAVDPSVVITKDYVDGRGDLITATTNNTPALLSLGTDGQVLIADTANGANTKGIKWGQVATAGIADSAVTSAKIADGSVTNAKLGLTEVKLRRAAAQSFSYSGSYQYANISWDTEDADVSGFITPTSDTLTVPAGASGLYLWSLRFTADLTSGAGVAVTLYNVLVNSVNTYAVSSFNAISNGPPSTVQESSSVYLTAGDTLQFRMRIYTDSTPASAGDMTATLWLTRIMD
jgi:hypothetical protein